MDTQRLILFVIFSFSAFILWDRWQAAHRPPLPTSAPTTAKPSSDTPSAVPRATPAASAPNAPAASAPNAPGASVPAPAMGEKIEIKTDRYVADVDTLGGSSPSRADPASRHGPPGKPYVLLQRNESRTFLAQSGLIGEGLPNHHSSGKRSPVRELGPGMDKLELKLAATTSSARR
jgi:YidC/Oxa1 family membrane protein insertase